MHKSVQHIAMIASCAMLLSACQPKAEAAPYEAVESKPLPQVTHENVMATPARQAPQAPDNSIMRSSGDAKMSKP